MKIPQFIFASLLISGCTLARADMVKFDPVHARVVEIAVKEGMAESIALNLVDSQTRKIKVGTKELNLVTGSYEGKEEKSVWKYVFSRLGDEPALFERIDEAGCEPSLVESAKAERLGRIGGQAIHALRLALVKSSCVGAENDRRKEIALLVIEGKSGLKVLAELPASEAGRTGFKIEKSRVSVTGSAKRSFDWDPKTKSFVER